MMLKAKGGDKNAKEFPEYICAYSFHDRSRIEQLMRASLTAPVAT